MTACPYSNSKSRKKCIVVCTRCGPSWSLHRILCTVWRISDRRQGKIAKLNPMFKKLSACTFAVTPHVLVLFTAVGPVLTTGARAQKIAEPHTAAAVIAQDEGWTKAEETGDTKYVDALLLPEYRSISSDGSTHDKAAILAHTAKGGINGEGAAKAKQWLAAHPHRVSVKINGDVAILTFALDKGIEPKPVMSCDIFVYRDGHWRALYSQHSEAGK